MKAKRPCIPIYCPLSSLFLVKLGIIFINCQFVLLAFNHPEIEWQTVPTKNFLIHYYDKTEPVVFAAWKIAEEAYENLASLYQINEETMINLVVSDYDDYSNGYADWTNRSIVIHVPDAHFDLRSMNTWLRNVITHELTHIMTLEKTPGMQLLNFNISAQYYSPNINLDYHEPLAMASFFPSWFIEGTAQLRAEDMGSDCWDSRRDMVLRCALLDNQLLSLAEMSHFTHPLIGNEMVYNQGYAFTKYLEAQLGKEKVIKLWQKSRGRKFLGTSLTKYFSTNFNTSLEILYSQWKDSLKNIYQQVLSPTLNKVTPVWQFGTLNSKPKVSPQGNYWGWLTNQCDDYSRTDLIIAHYGETKPLKRIKYAKRGWDFSSDESKIFFIKSYQPDKNGSFLNDLFSLDLITEETNQLTHSARIYDVIALADNQHLVCIQYNEGAFSLVSYSLAQTQFTPIVEGKLGEPWLSVTALPAESGKLVASRITQGKAGLFIVDQEKGNFTPLVHTNTHEENPCFGNNRIFFNADYDGIHNIYSVLTDGSDLRRHTRVTGGAFAPFLISEHTLIFSEYTSNGFRISQSSHPGIPFQLPEGQYCTYKDLPSPQGKVYLKPRDYKPKVQRPVWQIGQSVICSDYDRVLQNQIKKTSNSISGTIDLSLATEISFTQTDAVGLNNRMIGTALIFNASWEYDSLDNARKNDKKYPITLNGFGPRLFLPHLQNQEQTFNHTPYERGFSFLIRDYHCGYNYPMSSDETDSSEESAFSYPFIVPFFTVEKHSLAPTWGLNSMVALVTLLPYLVNLNPYLDWQLTRNLYWGFNPQMTFFLLRLVKKEKAGIALSSPLWIKWSNNLYSNEDIIYNKAGLTSINAFISQEITPKVFERDTLIDGTIQTEYEAKSIASFQFGLGYIQAIPIRKYASIILDINNTGTKYYDGDLISYNKTDTINASFTLTSLNNLSFIFPLKRNINKGRLYVDNLYGKIFYQLHFSAADPFLHNPKADLVIDKDYSSSNASLVHLLGFGLDLGLIKNYIFNRKLKIDLAWNLFEEEIIVDLSMHF